MRKEDVESVARKLLEIKDSLNELESALKSKNESKATAAKLRITNLQSEIGKLL